MSGLEAEGLYKVFGKHPEQAVRRLKSGVDRDELRKSGTTAAVIDAGFEVQPGEIFVVMGLSGSGKSTLLRLLNGLLEPTAGAVRFDGDDLTKLSPVALREVRARKISMVFQHFALFPHRSVLENAAYGLEVQGVEPQRRVELATEALRLTGLEGWEKSWPDELSGGMQQRVGLARALATDADLLLMDESFSALDPLIRRDMQDQLLDLQAKLQKTIVFITHDLNEAMRLGDRIAVMRDGRIVQVGTPEDILVRPANDYVRRFVEDVDRTRVLTAGSIMERSPQRPPADWSTSVSVPEDTPVAELFAPFADGDEAVGVTGPRGKLVGRVGRERLLSVLGETIADGDTAEGGEEKVTAGA